eukprot:m.163447 g.163447  ORF g.163447 m.163447 type:complete len:110 (+) comp14385_c1_seq1:3833-4162(+)
MELIVSDIILKEGTTDYAEQMYIEKLTKVREILTDVTTCRLCLTSHVTDIRKQESWCSKSLSLVNASAVHGTNTHSHAQQTFCEPLQCREKQHHPQQYMGRLSSDVVRK